MDKPEAGLRQRIFAWALDRLTARYERFVATRKQQLFSPLEGSVLEIGPGTGANLRYLNPDRVHWIGVEPNPFMERYLRREADRLRLPIELHIATAESLPVADASMDAVISTLVLCSVGKQQRSLQEILRVLKPGGTFAFIEHIAAPRGSRLRRIQNFVTPLWKRLGDGCNPNRETWAELEKAGFENLTYETLTASVPVVSPQIIGVARKAA
jgi:ubiquinone/menaquinone biosynthesis C-methylase UbiE